MSGPLCVGIIEDDADERVPLQIALEAIGIGCHSFRSAEEFLSSHLVERIGCLVIDLNLPGMSGLALQATLRERSSEVAAIIVSGNATVPSVIEAFHCGAKAVFEKPCDIEKLVRCVSETLLMTERRRESQQDCRQRLHALSPRERDVLELLVAGKSVKTIGRILGISASTADKHRARVLSKTGCECVVGLVQLMHSHFIAQPHSEFHHITSPYTLLTADLR